MAQWLSNPTRNHEVVGSIPSLSGLRIWCRSRGLSCGVGHRHGSNPALLWLWCRPAAVASIGPLAWEPPYALDAALKRQKDQKKKKNQHF